MVDIKKCSGTNIYVIHDILSKEQCKHFIREFSAITELQIIKQIPEVSSYLWNIIGSKLSSIEFVDEKNNKKFHVSSLKPYITITKARFGVGRHVDAQFGGDMFKIFFYLNKLSANGGTDFYENPDSEEKVSVNNEIGAAVLFDISLEHASQPFPSGEIKHVIGVRPNINYIQ